MDGNDFLLVVTIVPICSVCICWCCLMYCYYATRTEDRVLGQGGDAEQPPASGRSSKACKATGSKIASKEESSKIEMEEVA
mmetsp:Transcript_26675/g.49848  ORF Transcript_26675/g.49848 Transcript_26675/m.49848 type:complete len:81 (-) Transcript_26675:429-671(-)